MVYMLYVKLALIELALLNLMISLEPLRVLRTLRYTPRRGWNGSYASNISIVINDNDYILNKNVFYTALTRAKNRAIIIGTRKHINLAVKKNYENRKTLLAKKLNIMFGSK